MAEKDRNREPDEHYIPVELTPSAKRSEKDVENIRKLGDGAAAQAATKVARNKRSIDRIVYQGGR